MALKIKKSPKKSVKVKKLKKGRVLKAKGKIKSSNKKTLKAKKAEPFYDESKIDPEDFIPDDLSPTEVSERVKQVLKKYWGQPCPPDTIEMLRHKVDNLASHYQRDRSGSREVNRSHIVNYDPDNPPHVIKQYPVRMCAVDGCKFKAVGADKFCKRHGGDPIIRDNLLEFDKVPELTVLHTKFRPSYHPLEYIALAREGKSEVEIAAHFQVSVNTLRNWAKTYKEFNTATEIGAALYEAWWLQEGKANLDDNRYNTQMYKYLTTNKIGYIDRNLPNAGTNINVAGGVLLVPKPEMQAANWEETYKGNAQQIEDTSKREADAVFQSLEVQDAEFQEID